MCLLRHKSNSHIMTEDGIFAKIQAKCTFFHAVTPVKEHLHGSRMSFAIEIYCYLMFEQVPCLLLHKLKHKYKGKKWYF